MGAKETRDGDHQRTRPLPGTTKGPLKERTLSRGRTSNNFSQLCKTNWVSSQPHTLCL